MMPTRRGVAVWGLGYGVLFAVLQGRFALAGRTLAIGDGLYQSFPAFFAPREFWTPLLFSGYPIGADPQAMLWYPVAFLLARATHSYDLFVASAYLLAAIFQLLFVRRLTGSLLAGGIAGLVFSLSGFFVGHVGHPNMLHAAAWFPLVLFGVDLLRDERSRLWPVAPLALGLATLAGYPQILLRIIVVAALFSLVRAKGAPCGSARYLGRTGAALAAGLALGGAILLPAWELAGRSLRSAIDFEFFVQGSFPPWQLPSFVFPAIAGGWRTLFNATPYFGEWFVTDLTGWLGWCAPVLALAALGIADRRLTRFFAILGVVSLVLMLGKATPLAALLFHVPLFSQFRSPSRDVLLLILSVSTLAGLAVAGLAGLEPAGRVRALRRGIAFFALPVGAAILAVILTAGRIRSAAEARFPGQSVALSAEVFLWPLVFGAAALGAAFFWAKQPSPFRAALLGSALVFELVEFGWLHPTSNFPAASITRDVPPDLARLAETLWKTNQRLAPLEGRHQPHEAGLPNLTAYWNIPNASGHGPLVLSSYHDVTGLIRWGEMSGDVLRPENLALDLLAVRYLLVPASRPVEPDGGLRFLRHGSVGETVILENRRALPRAFTVARLVTVPRPEILEAIRTSRLPDGAEFDPRTTALVERPPASSSPLDPEARVEIEELRGSLVRLRVASKSAAFVVLSDVWYPGWECAIDGSKAEILESDAILRGIPVPAGEHAVRLRFRPWANQAGIALSLLSAATIAGLFIRQRVRRADGTSESGSPPPRN